MIGLKNISWFLASCVCLLSSQSSFAQSFQVIDFRNYDIQTLNTGGDWVQVVFDLPPERMSGGPNGVKLEFDVATHTGPFDYTFRSELRESDIISFPAENTSQIYHARFSVDELPELCGPMTIFQRFNRDNDGPDIEVELTGKNQFGNAVANDLQIVAFDEPRLRLGKFLKPQNDLKVALVTSSNGAYKVSLNGESLSQVSGLNTLPSPDGTWSQFGLYPHGLHDFDNRQDQLDTGETGFAFTYQSYSKTEFDNVIDLTNVETVDLNGLVETLIINTGSLAVGSVEALAESDNLDVSIRRGNSVQSIVQFDLTGTSWIESPEELMFVYEASVFARSGVTQTISLLNFESGQYEVVDSRPASRFVDSRVAVLTTGDPTRFVEESTKKMKGQVRYQGDVARLQFTANVDQAFWIAN